MDNKYYWLKLKRDFFKRHDIQIVEDMENGKEYVLLYLKLMAESVDHEGRLRFNDVLPYNIHMLSTITRTSLDNVQKGLDIFQELGLITIEKDDTICITGMEKMLGSETYWAKKKREQRNKMEEDVGQSKDNVQISTNNSQNKLDSVQNVQVRDRDRDRVRDRVNNKEKYIQKEPEKNEEPEKKKSLKETILGYTENPKLRKEILSYLTYKEKAEKEKVTTQDVEDMFYKLDELTEDDNDKIETILSWKKENKNKRFKEPTIEEIIEYCEERNNGINSEKFFNFYKSKGWMVGKNKMVDWKSAVITWENNKKPQQKTAMELLREDYEEEKG